jgi:hypothetical protein
LHSHLPFRLSFCDAVDIDPFIVLDLLDQFQFRLRADYWLHPSVLVTTKEELIFRNDYEAQQFDRVEDAEE